MPLPFFMPENPRVDESPALLEFLAEATEKESSVFKKAVMFKDFQDGERLIQPGDACMHFFIAVKGRMRVFTSSDSGRELTLYHVEPAGSCMLTCWSILSRGKSLVSATAMDGLELALVDARHLSDWVNRYTFWRNHVQDMMLVRLGDMVRMIESISFHSLETRLARWLLAHKSEELVTRTHQDIANELGSSREVISRMLSRIRKFGFIQQERSGLKVLEATGLEELAADDR